MKKIWMISFLVIGLTAQIFAAGGNLDTSFTAGATQFGTGVDAVAVQTDGRILIGGNFRSVNGRFSPGVARLNADGSSDTTFNVGTGTDNGFSAASVFAIAVQTDGRILIGGSFLQFNGTAISYLARLNSNGSLDTTFNMGGSGFDSAFYVEAITIEPDGQILVGGSLFQYNGTMVGNFLRLNSNGSLDTTFNTNIGTGFDALTRSIALESDGQIVVVGAFTLLNGTSANYIARLNANGTPDATFITNNGTGFNNPVATVALQADGRIVCGGGFTFFNGTSRDYLARLNANGTLDTGFASASLNASIVDIQIQADGQIIAAGGGFFGAGFERQNLARINQTDGTLDLSFDTGTGPFAGATNSLAIQTDGSILVAGAYVSFNGVTRFSFARIASSGTLNAAFTPVIGAPATVNEILVLPDNEMFIGGDFRGVNGTFRDALARINADGTTDTAFNPTGLDTGGFGVVHAIAVQTDGRVIVAGNFSNAAQGFNFGIVRLNADGSLDNTFNASVNSTINAVAVQTDGRILIGGSFTVVNATNIGYLARLNADGTTDTTFNNGGIGFDNSVQDLVLLSSGQILVGGDFTAYNGTSGVNYIARINSNGLRDAAFTTSTGTSFDTTVYALAVQTDGRIVAGGNFTIFNGSGRIGLARLNSSGTLDGTFTVGAGFNNFPTELALQPDGRILAVGNFTAYNGTTRHSLARINTNGSLDTSFDSFALVNTNLAAIGLQSCEGIVIGGSFAEYDGTPRVSLARISAGADRTWTGAMNSDWNTAGNWSGGAVPTTNDKVIIPNNQTVNLSGNFDVMTLSVGTNSTLTIGAGSSLTTECTVCNGAIAGAGTLNYEGRTFENNGTVSTSAVNIVAGIGQTKSLFGTGSFSNNTLTIGAGLLLTMQSNHIFSTINFSGTGTLDAANRTINLRGANPLQSLGVLTTTNSSVIYDGTSTQTIGVVSYHNLTLNNSTGANLGGNVTVGNSLTLQSGTLGVGTNTLTLNGTVTSAGGDFSSSPTGTVNYNQASNGQTVVSGNYGNLTFSNFNKNLTNATIGISGTLTPGSGTHTITGSTFIYNGTTAQTLSTGFMTYNNLTINNPAGASGFAGLTVQGLLRVQQGTFTSSSTYNNVQIDSGATLAGTNATTINVSGSWTNNGTFTPNNNTVSFNGTSAQSVGGSATTNFSNLTINNASGVTLNHNTNVGNLTLMTGNLSLGANTLVLSGNASRTSGHIIGNLRKNYPVAGNFTFPVGTASGYSPVAINVTAGTFPLSFDVRTVQGNQPILGALTSLQRYWQISPSAGSNPTANMTFNYLQTDVMGTESAYKVLRVSGLQILSLPHNPPNVVIDTTGNTATVLGATAFSDWTLGEFAPSSAQVFVGGRVSNVFGNGIGKVFVTLTKPNGEIQTVSTNAFGYYRFENLEAGASYTISVRNKRFVFIPDTIIISPSENVENADFTASP